MSTSKVKRMTDKTFRHYDIPAGRTLESFAYKIEELDYTNVTDALYTDEKSEVERIVPRLLEQGYNACVTHDGTQHLYVYKEDV